LNFRIVRGCRQQYADAPHPIALLRARRERPRCRAAIATRVVSTILEPAEGKR